jgi:hypothetical protein
VASKASNSTSNIKNNPCMFSPSNFWQCLLTPHKLRLIFLLMHIKLT